MPILPWRCQCLRGSLSAYGALTALTRPFSKERPRPPRLCRLKRKSHAGHPSRKKPVSPPHQFQSPGVVHSHPHAASQPCSSSFPLPGSSGREVVKACDVDAAPGPPCTTEEKERDLLRYFGRGRSMYDTVPLQSTSFALQRASCAQAQRVPLVTLFPASPLPEASASHSISTAPRPTTASRGVMGIRPSLSRPMGSTVREAERPTRVAPATTSSPLAHFSASDLFSSYEPQEREHSDWLQFRLLSARLSNSLDSNKFFGAAEVPLRSVCADLAELWGTACTAWEQALRIWSGVILSASARFSQHNSVCFLVCYVHTQQKVAIGMSMQRIADEVCALARASATPQLFRMIPIFIGMRRQAVLSMDAAVCNSLVAEGEAAVDSQTDTVTYPTGGLYTVAETVQCITRFGPHVFNPRESRDGFSHAALPGASPELVCTLEPQVFLLSESWLHVRSIADLHGDNIAKDYAPFDDWTGSAASSATSGLRWSHRGHDVTSFVPELTRRNVHVVPAVVGDRLSQKEERAIARYIWCNVQRQVRGRRTVKAGQSPSRIGPPVGDS